MGFLIEIRKNNETVECASINSEKRITVIPNYVQIFDNYWNYLFVLLFFFGILILTIFSKICNYQSISEEDKLNNQSKIINEDLKNMLLENENSKEKTVDENDDKKKMKKEDDFMKKTLYESNKVKKSLNPIEFFTSFYYSSRFGVIAGTESIFYQRFNYLFLFFYFVILGIF
jgi:hypothetical protein